VGEVFLRSFPSLVILFALGAGVLWLRRKQLGGAPGSRVRVVGRAGLLRSATVAVIEADGKRYLIGATEQRVELLSELGDASAAEDLGNGTDVDLTSPAATDGASSSDGLASSSNLSASGPWMDLLSRAQSARSWRPPRSSDRAEV
jgi:flagellar protein FliO/FliZ